MPVVKSQNVECLTRSAIVLDLGDLKRESERLMEHARAQAQAVLDQAEAEAAELIAGATERGFAQGMQQGEAAGREQGEAAGRAEALQQYGDQLSQLIDSWSSALEQWEGDRSEMLNAARGDVMQFAFDMARKIVLRVIEFDPVTIQRQLDESLSLICRPTSLSIEVHPDDVPMANDVLPTLVTRLGECGHVELREQPHLTRGGCIVATHGGRVDASIETQVQRIAEAVLPADQPAIHAPSGEPSDLDVAATDAEASDETDDADAPDLGADHGTPTGPDP